jgi:transcriptional regulator with XRE-family HTH domain
MPKTIPYRVRRARFLLGMTQSQFAELFEVNEGTVSRWERGKLVPAPEKLDRIRDINLSAVIEDATKASPVLKYAAHMDDLKHPVLVSKGVREAIRRLGISEDMPSQPEEVLPATPEEHSCLHAFELIQQDRLWINRRTVYVETHCLSARFGWVDGVIAPLPFQDFALVEFAPSPPRRDGERISVRFRQPEDLK